MAKARVLLVESTQPVIVAVPPALEAAGYTVRVVGSAARALSEVAEEPYDLALVSLHPPDMDGPALLGGLRARRHDIGLVLLAPAEERADAFAARTVGAHAFLEIPQDLSREKILTAVENTLEHRRLQQELDRVRGGPTALNLEERERQAILQALEATRWNKQAAARLLGLHRPTLYAKLRKHGLPQRPPA